MDDFKFWMVIFGVMIIDRVGEIVYFGIDWMYYCFVFYFLDWVGFVYVFYGVESMDVLM